MYSYNIVTKKYGRYQMKDNETAAVSVIVPIYNQEKYLQECLDSIINQTLKEIEILCINGGSTDGTASILEKYANRDLRIKVITEYNLGEARNCNVGIDNATGKYLTFVHSDDYIDSKMCEILFNKAEENQLDVVKYNHYYIKDDCIDKIRQVYLRREIIDPYYYNVISNIHKDKRFFSMCMPMWSGLYNREFIQKNHIWANEDKETSFVDNGFTFQVMLLAKRMCFINRGLYFYRMDNVNSLSRQDHPYKKIRREYDFIRRFLERDEERYKTYIAMYHFFKYCNYQYVYSITPEEEKEEVRHQMAVEFAEAIKKNEAKADIYFSSEQWKNYIEIASWAV